MDDFDRLDHVMADVVEESSRISVEELHALGQLAVSIIALRTKTGADADGRPFVPYSKEYAAERRKKGYGTKVDLARTGHMIGAILPKVEGASAVLRFASPLEETKALSHNDPQKPGRKKREFFDIRLPAELDLIENEIGQAVFDRLEKKIR